MSKRKRSHQNDFAIAGGNRFSLNEVIHLRLAGKCCRHSLGSKQPQPIRRSTRLQDVESQRYAEKVDDRCHLPSPATSRENTDYGRKRRRHAASEKLLSEDKQYPKRRRVSPSRVEEAGTVASSPIDHWVHTKRWPPISWEGDAEMSTIPSSKRRSESSHRSQILERMNTHGVFMESSNQVQKKSQELCDEYLKGSRKVVKSSIFSSKEFSQVLDRVRSLNEARIQRDIMPWVVPSAEILFFRGELQFDWIGEEISAEWIRCATLGSTRPKPDYAAGLLRHAFTEDEIKKLERHASPTQPFHFTPDLCFPFLVCEAKTGERGMNEADRQNIHSASIAVRAIIMLYREAFEKTEPHRLLQLYGQVLVFTVSHDNDRIFLYGHFAVTDPGLPSGLKFYRYPIGLFSLTTNGGADRFKGYNFVRNIYEKFAPAHRTRIQDALACIPSPPERTGISFAASDLSLDQVDSQQDSQELSQGEEAFRRPGHPSSASQQREMAKVKEQLEQQRQESKQQIDKLLDQMEQQRHQMEQQRQHLEQQLREQRQDTNLQTR